MACKSRSKKRKRRNASPPDLISDLPRNIIDGIMERLPLRNAAQLCVLSRKWHHIWSSTPCLNFDAHSFVPNQWRPMDQLSTILNKILLQHHGPILKFSLYLFRYMSREYVSQWVSFLSVNHIRDLAIENPDYYSVAFKLSSSLFSCVELEKLKLRHCEFILPRSFGGFRKLVSLELEKVNLNEDTLEDLIMKCPLLENLSIKDFKDLRKVKVDAPNLKHFTVDGIFNSLSLKTAENLVSAAISFRGSVKTVHKTSVLDLMDVLANSPKLENLFLGGFFCKVLRMARLTPTTFEKLRVLKLSSLCLNWIDDFHFSVNFIKSCPNIEELYISVGKSNTLDAQALAYNPNFTLRHLRWAKMSICDATNAELQLMEFLLGCSPALEEFSVTYVEPIRSSTRSTMLTQLNRFHRASPKVQVICPDPIVPVESSDESDHSTDSDDNSSDSD